jgi:hypothetical protein
MENFHAQLRILSFFLHTLHTEKKRFMPVERIK